MKSVSYRISCNYRSMANNLKVRTVVLVGVNAVLQKDVTKSSFRLPYETVLHHASDKNSDHIFHFLKENL